MDELNPMPGMKVEISVQGMEQERLRKIEEAEAKRAEKWAGLAVEVQMLPPGAAPEADVVQTDESIRLRLGVPDADFSRTRFAVDENGDLVWIVDEEG